VLSASNAPRVDVNSINFQVHSGVVVPSSISVVSASTFPALIDTFPAYRDNSFFVVDDEVVFVDRDRRIVDVVPAGPRTRFSGAGGVGGSGGGVGSGGTMAAIDLPPDDVRVVQRVLIERGLLQGEADGILGNQTREAITVYQRQMGLQVTGSIDARTVSSLGVSARLSQQANQPQPVAILDDRRPDLDDWSGTGRCRPGPDRQPAARPAERDRPNTQPKRGPGD